MTSTRTPSISSPTSTTGCRSPRCSRPGCPTSSSTGRPVSPSAWRPTSRRTTWARRSRPSIIWSTTRTPRSKICGSSSRVRTSRPARSFTAAKEMNLKELLEHFIEHRHTVITRRTEFELKRAQDREHILEGLKIAVDNIDEVVKIIRKSKDTPSADASLRKRFKLSEKQSAEILNMRLARLTALEITKLEDELKEVRKFIKECKEILGSKPRRLKILKEELSELAHGLGDERRTEIVADQGEFSIEDLIAEEDMVITVSHAGYIKRMPDSATRHL